MRILVTGIGGYIGSVVADELIRRGHNVVGLDNFSQGHKDAINPGVKLTHSINLADGSLDDVFQNDCIDAVCHLAAETVVEKSMTDPALYFKNNVVGSLNLLNAMVKYDVKRMIFSSSAAVYGNHFGIPYYEAFNPKPCNSYGESKLIVEQLLKWYRHAYGLKYIAFRYFNVAGANHAIGEDHRPETHLIPNVLKAAIDGSPVSIFGLSHQTKDGTCIRDYVHVQDVARAHVLALSKIDYESEHWVYNLGSVKASVLDVVRCAREITRIPISTVGKSARPGDPAILTAITEKAENLLDWHPEYTELDGIVESAWNWFKNHPRGYKN